MSEEKQRKPGAGCGWFLLVLIAVGAVWAGISEFGGSAPPEPGVFHNADTTTYSDGTRYDGGLLPAFAPDASQQLTASLAELEKAYGICFGWSLEDGSTKKVALGSSRGPGVAAKTCPRWLETQVAVGYTSDSSESLEGVRIRVDGSADFPRVPREDDFARLGVTAPALVEDPVGGTGHAALGLPLLMVESGALEAVATPPPADAPTPRPLGPAGSSDFPLSTTLTLSGLGAGVLVCVALGFWMRSRSRKKTGDTPDSPPGPPRHQPGYGPPPAQAPGQPQTPDSQRQVPGQPPVPGRQPPPGQAPGRQNPGQQQSSQQPWPGQPQAGYQQPGYQHGWPGQQNPGQQNPAQQYQGQQSPGQQNAGPQSQGQQNLGQQNPVQQYPPQQPNPGQQQYPPPPYPPSQPPPQGR